MQLPLYQLLELTAKETGLQSLLQAGQQGVLVFLALLSFAACFVGFKLYRPMASAVMMLLVIFFGFHWLCPAWGMLKGITFCAVIGCSAAVVTFLAFHFSALVFSAGVTAGFLLLLLGHFDLPVWAVILLAGIPALGAAVLTHFFPFWSITGFTALWGSTAFAFDGAAQLMPQIGAVSLTISIMLSVVLFVAGFAFQLFIFRKQTLFKKIMPDKLLYKLEQKKGGSAVA